MTDSTCHQEPAVLAIVHASAVLIGGGACIFLGPSGTGKSTMHQLLNTHPHVQPLANEAVQLTQQADGKWSVSNADRQAYQGSPSSEGVTSLEAGPLEGIFRLFRAPTPSVKRIDSLKTCRYLTDALFEIAWQREYDPATKSALFSNLAAACRAVPGYEFCFDLSPETLEVFIRHIDI